MKSLFTVIFLCLNIFSFGQTESEKKVVEIINQVRTNPLVFLNEVALPYIEENELSRNRYAKSLIRELDKVDSMQPLAFENSLQRMSEEFADEAGKKGWVGHKRTSQRFEKHANYIDINAENLQYGYDDPLDIVMDLLIDIDIPNLGHRKNILEPRFSLVGVSIKEHKTYDFITVMSFGGFEK
jgi:uncharacterized protein YkwD